MGGGTKRRARLYQHRATVAALRWASAPLVFSCPDCGHECRNASHHHAACDGDRDVPHATYDGTACADPGAKEKR
jgi:hypothetical protein